MATPGKTARALGLVGLVTVLMLAGLPAPAPTQLFRTLAAGAGENDRGPHKEFSLRLVFALQSGPYVGGVSVTIRDESGRTVVDTLSPGPWLFVELPPGTYQLRFYVDFRSKLQRNPFYTFGASDVSGVMQITVEDWPVDKSPLTELVRPPMRTAREIAFPQRGRRK